MRVGKAGPAVDRVELLSERPQATDRVILHSSDAHKPPKVKTRRETTTTKQTRPSTRSTYVAHVGDGGREDVLQSYAVNQSKRWLMTHLRRDSAYAQNRHLCTQISQGKQEKEKAEAGQRPRWQVCRQSTSRGFRCRPRGSCLQENDDYTKKWIRFFTNQTASRFQRTHLASRSGSTNQYSRALFLEKAATIHKYMHLEIDDANLITFRRLNNNQSSTFPSIQRLEKFRAFDMSLKPSS